MSIPVTSAEAGGHVGGVARAAADVEQSRARAHAEPAQHFGEQRLVRRLGQLAPSRVDVAPSALSSSRIQYTVCCSVYLPRCKVSRTSDIPLDEARALIARAIDKAAQIGVRGAFAVVGGSGVLVSASRMDRGGAGGMARARSKAWISATQQIPSAEHHKRMATLPPPIAAGFVACSPEAHVPGRRRHADLRRRWRRRRRLQRLGRDRSARSSTSRGSTGAC